MKSLRLLLDPEREWLYRIIFGPDIDLSTEQMGCWKSGHNINMIRRLFDDYHDYKKQKNDTRLPIRRLGAKGSYLPL